MTTKYWVGNGGNWSDTAHWSSTSGGTGGASVPSTGDTATFDANSASSGYNVDVSAPILCHLDTTNQVNLSLNILSGGSLSLQEGISCSSLMVQGGNFVTNNYDINASRLGLIETSIVDLGSSTVNCNDPDDSAQFVCDSTVYLSAGLATIILTSGFEVDFLGGGQNYGTVQLIATSSGCLIQLEDGTHSHITNLSINGDANVELGIASGEVETIGTSLTLSGVTEGNLIINGNGGTLSMASGTVDATNCTISNFTATGGATFYALTSNGCIDGGGNTGWIFIDVPAIRYWVGNSGNWNDISHWSYTSGGEGGAQVPTINDDVIFDENSFSQDTGFINFGEE